MVEFHFSTISLTRFSVPLASDQISLVVIWVVIVIDTKLLLFHVDLQLGGHDNVAEITGRRGMLVRAPSGKGVVYQARNT